MNRLLSTIILGIAAANAALAGPQISWLAESHDFGIFNEDAGEQTCSFRLVNTGDEPLCIFSARASCGCTTPRYSKTPIAPGDTSAIEVTFDPTGRPGRFSKRIMIESNAAHRSSKLLIEGVVIGSDATIASQYPYDMGPLRGSNASLMFGEVTRGRLKTVYLNGYNRSTATIKPQLAAQPRHIDVAFVPDTIAPGERMSMIFYLRSERCELYGLNTDTVMICSDKGAQPVPVVLTSMVEEDFSFLSDKALAKAPAATIADERLDCKRLSRGSSVTLTTSITNAGGGDKLAVRRIYSHSPAFKFAAYKDSIKKGKSSKLTVTGDTAALPADSHIVNATVTVVTNDPAHPRRELRVVGEILD